MYCSFCGKSQDEVFFIITGPAVYICDECVLLCNEIIFKESHNTIERLKLSLKSHINRTMDRKFKHMWE